MNTMLFLRKADLTVQLVLGGIILLALPLLPRYGFMAGLFLPGFHQLVSASLNTGSFISHGLAGEIGRYWKFTGLLLALTILSVLLTGLPVPTDAPVWPRIVFIATLPLAIYYLNIYKKLIRTLVFRGELAGLVRSKH